MTISTRLAIIIFTLMSVCLLALFFSVKGELRDQQQNGQKIFTTTLAESIASSIGQNFDDGEKNKLAQLLRTIAAENNDPIEYLYISDADGNVFAHSYSGDFPTLLKKHPSLARQNPEEMQQAPRTALLASRYDIPGSGLIQEYDLPLIAGLEPTLHIGLNQSSMLQRISQTSNNILSLGFFLVLLTVAISWLFIRQMMKPVHKYAAVLKNYHSAGPLDLSQLKSTIPELQILSRVLQDVFNTRDGYENDLKEQKQHLEVTLNSIGDGVITTDAEGNINQINPAAEHLTGWTTLEARGLPVSTVFSIVNASTREPISNPVEEVLGTGNTVYLSNHTTLIAKDGAEYQIADSAAPIRDSDQKISGMVLVFNDVTEQYHLREAAKNVQQQLQQTLDDMQTMVGLTRTDGTLIFINKAPYKALGFSEDQVMGKQLWNSPWFNYSPEIQATIKKECLTAASGATSVCEVYLNSVNGLRLIEITTRPLFDQDHKVSRLILEGKDITVQHDALLTVKQQEVELREILSSLEDSVITVDEKGLILSCNSATETLFGYQQAEVLAQHISLLAPDPHKSEHGDYMVPYLLTGEKNIIGINREVIAQRKNKTTFPMRLSVAELPKSEDGLRRFVGSCQDLTKIKLQQAQLQRAQKMEALGKLVGGVAHDYNNILGIILGYNELIGMKYADVDGLNRYIDNISQAVTRGQNLTHRMLAFSKQKSTEPKSVDIRESFKSQQDLLSKSVTSRVKVVYNFCKPNWPIWVDPSEFEDAILNLTINAQHAMPDGGTLTFTTTALHLSGAEVNLLHLPENDYIKLSVTDTGTGIDEETKLRIFEPFFSTKGSKNSGLGLSQVYGFMERAGGTVDLYSQAGKGSEFSLYFPRYIGSQTNPITETPDIISQGKGQNILIVDDESALREVAKEILEIAGYRVSTANDGLSALSMLANNPVDLILSDVIMPNMDGYHLAEEVKKLYPAIKIQLASGFSDDRHISHPDLTLHDKMISKPYTSSVLLRRVAALLKEGLQ